MPDHLSQDPAWLSDLLQRIGEGEDLEIECKEAAGGLPRDLWSTISAFANTRGGHVVLGLQEQKDGSYVVRGVPRARERLQEFWNLMRNQEKISHDICDLEGTRIISIEGKEIILIRVMAASRKHQPVYINGNPYKGTYVRRNSGDFLCKKPEVDRMMRESSGDTADTAIVSGFGMEDLDQDALIGYRRRFQTRDPAHPWNEYDDWQFLGAIRGARKDRQSREESITVAGLLMFGLPEAIRDWRSRHLIDFRLLDLKEQEERWADRIAWDGHLYGAFFKLYPRLIEDQPTPFRLDKATRSDQSPAHVALREALVNLLVHADYSESTASLILRSPEGYLFRNPGTSLVPEPDMLEGNRSDPRNPSITFMFRQLGLAEEAGTGISRIIQAWKTLGFQLPDIHSISERYEFELILRYAHLISQEDREWLRSIGSTWTEEEQLALVLARHGSVDSAQLRSVTRLRTADAAAVLTRLTDRELLQEEVNETGTKYVLTFGAESGAVKQRPIFQPPGESVWQELLEIGRPLRDSARTPPPRRDPIIVRLCGRQPLSLEELTELTGYKLTTIRGIVQDLVRSGQLRYLFPEKATHPEQKYVAKEGVA